MRGGGGGGSGGGGGDARKPYNLNIGINFNNLLNNVNFGQPDGTLSSSRFGQSTSTAGSLVDLAAAAVRPAQTARSIFKCDLAGKRRIENN